MDMEQCFFFLVINTLTLHIIPCFSAGYVSDPCDHDRCCDCSLPDSSIHRKAKSRRCRPAPGALWVSHLVSKLLIFATILGGLVCKVVAKCIDWHWQLPNLATCFWQGSFWGKITWPIKGFMSSHTLWVFSPLLRVTLCTIRLDTNRRRLLFFKRKHSSFFSNSLAKTDGGRTKKTNRRTTIRRFIFKTIQARNATERGRRGFSSITPWLASYCLKNPRF